MKNMDRIKKLENENASLRRTIELLSDETKPFWTAMVEDRAHWISETERLASVLELIATSKRSDGTYNRSREACEKIAREAIDGINFVYIKNDIAKMVKERNALLKSDNSDNKVDELSEQIWQTLREFQKDLPLEFIIESLTSLGAAPSVLYDDNGHFTIGEEGSQNMPTFEMDFEEKETAFVGDWIVKPGHWKRSIREALELYFESRE
jgi:hypothetical protein